MSDIRLMPGAARAGAFIALALVAGCSLSKRDSVVVGAIPDDYRTNHPIVISDRQEKIDIPVSATSHRMNGYQKTALEGFLASYDRQSDSVVSIAAPSGGLNDLAASEVSRDMMRHMKGMGIPPHRVSLFAYQAVSADAEGPIRIAYTTLKASTGRCGRWTDDLLNNAANRHYTDFGCSYQNNLAAQIANPADLLGPRKPTEIDAENRGGAIVQYKARAVADDFNSNSEIDY